MKIKSIILCAGYATRLYPLTKNNPKPLLEVNGRPIIEHIILKLGKIREIDEIYVVTNNKFFSHFLEWQARNKSGKKITIVNDRTKSNDDRLGSLGDIKYVVENMNVADDIMIIAGDNIFEFSLNPIVELHKEKNKPVVALYDVKDKELAKQYGIVSVNSENKIVDFREKPQEPKSTLSSTGIYIYPRESVLKLIEFTKNNDADKAGNFLEWLYKNDDVYCHITEKKWFDIGTKEQLEKARNEFRG
ncbi:NTP transferase domain-containing protein [Candidatus Woesearchaeota archaeon]|nr:NTP transferase domain-containing protein [Candidatus Woesearchaeota archaeon]